MHNVNRLTDVGALIADSPGRALILIEIEERPSSPKKIVGDIFALAMSNHVAVGRGDQAYFTIGAHTRVIIAGRCLRRGRGARSWIPGMEPRGGGLNAPRLPTTAIKTTQSSSRYSSQILTGGSPVSRRGDNGAVFDLQARRD